ncbi:MAG: hypothetical protein QXH42_08520 [Thermoplasmata archaeon]
MAIMGVDLVPRLKKMRRYGIHFTAGGGDMIACFMLFTGAGGSVLEAIEKNYGYVKKADALRLADRLDSLYERLRKDDVRPYIEYRAPFSKKKLEALVLSIARDIGLPKPPK